MVSRAGEQAPILILSFTAPSPFMMEHSALTGALRLLAHLQLQGTVSSGCQGLQRNVLRRNTTSPG